MTTARYAYQDPAALVWAARLTRVGLERRQERLAREAVEQEQPEHRGATSREDRRGA